MGGSLKIIIRFLKALLAKVDGQITEALHICIFVIMRLTAAFHLHISGASALFTDISTVSTFRQWICHLYKNMKGKEMQSCLDAVKCFSSLSCIFLTSPSFLLFVCNYPASQPPTLKVHADMCRWCSHERKASIPSQDDSMQWRQGHVICVQLELRLLACLCTSLSRRVAYTHDMRIVL